MAGKPTYHELEQKNKQLEKEVLEYVRKANELNQKQNVTECSHIRRTISLMHINEELNREIKEFKRSDTEGLELVAHKLQARIKELNCLYDISSFGDATNFSLDGVLQAIVDFIPPAIQHPEITCARLIFGDYEIKTKNFRDTKWKISREIAVADKWIDTLEVFYLEEKPELEEEPFLKEAKILVNAVAENIAKIIDREEAEVAKKKHQDHIEALIKKTVEKVTHIE